MIEICFFLETYRKECIFLVKGERIVHSMLTQEAWTRRQRSRTCVRHGATQRCARDIVAHTLVSRQAASCHVFFFFFFFHDLCRRGSNSGRFELNRADSRRLGPYRAKPTTPPKWPIQAEIVLSLTPTRPIHVGGSSLSLYHSSLCALRGVRSC